ncbi:MULTISPECIES: DUF397 domain-containing protein [Prauserella salsuginis group]|uniref:DUF397 domain-containing protein n=2 Tax=Prauserella salsuginis group TaxID=2893672 RepID=A0A839XGW5_9PSEU|nr:MULTISPECIES: DUF397 domain-containing protein [Prauserella salsuginis group]MBB3663212.1 hypothetical protein [Prauserella sediminis]MCR3720961.1 protein of unknown function (DUF397) [Prauserella flava]MCR3734958.1 protein of unknown function (DUF397) [Prauserella salsuginis]
MADRAVETDYYDPATVVSRFDPTGWQKSFASEPNGGNCVEVNLGDACGDGNVGVRDTKLDDSPVFMFTRGEWQAFVTAVKAGQFDLPA